MVRGVETGESELGMTVELQEIVDRLGHLLQRSVAVDDPNLQIIAYSHHYGDEDSARLQALVKRGAAENMVKYLAGHRIHTWHEPRYMEADESLGLKKRLVIPLWAGTNHIGFIWIIVEGELAPHEFELALADVQEITRILESQANKQQAALQEKTRKIRDLLLGSPQERQSAAEFLQTDRNFAAAHSFNVLLIQHQKLPINTTSISQNIFSEALHKALGSHLGQAFALAECEAGRCVLVSSKAVLTARDLEALCQRVHREITLHAQSPGSILIGAGARAESLVRAHESFAQAKIAAREAWHLEKTTLTWAQMGPAALLPALVQNVPAPFLIPQQFQLTLAEQAPEMLKLLEVYLESAGNAAETAQRLHLHRSSVYYNIGQFQKTTGWDLTDGNSRFYVHLWLKTRKTFLGGAQNLA